MTDSPERIWINKTFGQHPEDWNFSVGEWETEGQLKEKVCYVREDLPQWQPIETAPKDGTAIIVLHSEEGPLIGYYTAFWKTYGEYLHGQEEVTHWMPLPEPPK